MEGTGQNEQEKERPSDSEQFLCAHGYMYCEQYHMVIDYTRCVP